MSGLVVQFYLGGGGGGGNGADTVICGPVRDQQTMDTAVVRADWEIL